MFCSRILVDAAPASSGQRPCPSCVDDGQAGLWRARTRWPAPLSLLTSHTEPAPSAALPVPGLVRAARHVDSARWRVLTLRTWRSRVGDFAADLSERDGLPAAGEMGRGLLALGRVSPGTSVALRGARGFQPTQKLPRWMN